MVNLKDSGAKSGMVWAGKFRIYTANKKDWIDMTVDANGDLLLTNRAGETATVNLT